MPHPGLEVVQDQSYDGRFSRLHENFQDNLIDLLNSLLVPKNLKKKRVLDVDVTGATFKEYVKTYFQTFQSKDTPEIKSIYEATIERQYANFVQTAMDLYKKGLKKYEPKYNSTNFTAELTEVHDGVKEFILLRYNSEKKMGTYEHENKYRDLLENEISAYYEQWKEGMMDTRNKIRDMETKIEEEKQKVLDEANAKMKIATDQMKAEAEELSKRMEDQKLKIEKDLLLKDEEKEAALKKLKEENDLEKKRAEEEKQTIIKSIEEEKEKLLKENEERVKNTEEEIRKLKEERENQNTALQLQLQQDREDRIAQMKLEAEERKEERRLQQERWDKQDAERKEEMKLLEKRFDDEAKERRAQLERDEKQREVERKELREQRRQDEERRQQYQIKRDQEQRQQQAEFHQRMIALKSNGSTRESQSLLGIIFAAVAYLVNVMIRNY